MRSRKKCKGCDEWFPVYRSDTLTCSPRCRKRYERICRKITETMRLDEKARQEARRGKN